MPEERGRNALVLDAKTSQHLLSHLSKTFDADGLHHFTGNNCLTGAWGILGGPPKFPKDQNTQTSSWHETTRCLFSTLSGYQGSMIMSCRPGYYPLLRASSKFVPHAHKPQFSGHEVIACASDISASNYSCSRISMYRALSIS